MADPPDDGIDDFLPDSLTARAAREWREERDRLQPTVVPFDQSKRRKKAKPPPPGGWPAWHAKLLTDDRDRPIAEHANVLIALRNEPGMAFAVSFNEMSQRSLAMTAWPIAPGAGEGAETPHEITDDDISRLQEWLQHSGLPRIGRETVRDGIEEYARERRIHPLRDKLTAIEWDGVPRVGTWLHACLGCPDDDYHVQIGTCFLISMVARIIEPGCKVDYMMVLEGPQGEEKSKFCQALAGGDEYFSEHLPRIDSDPIRLSMHLRGKWLIEVSELAAFLKADPEAMKHFTSRRHEQYTPKYGRSEVIEPRQCVFIGTTNEDDYIRDVTGGRRYWPVKVVRVDIAALEGMRDQLFAEAHQLYREGVHWWPEREFEKQVIAPVQDGRQWHDAWAERVEPLVSARSQITISELAQLLGLDTNRLDRMAQRRLADILRSLGWRKVRSTNGARVWRNLENSDPSDPK
jgi:predicted P-loop ATPase